MSTAENHIRRPWLAVLLSLLCTGLGHIYCGRFVKGFVLYTISFFFMPVIAVSAAVGINTLALLVIAAGYGAVSAVYLYAVLDSHKAARQCSQPFLLRDYNNLVVYILLVLLQIPFSVGIAFQFRAHVMEAFYCPARSMEPTLQVGDRFLVNKTAYASRSPQRGDVIVFNSPEDRRRRWVKRVIATAGDTIEVRGNEVILNGQPLARKEVEPAEPAIREFDAAGNLYWEENGNACYLVQLDSRDGAVNDFEETRVPPGMVFVLGDNRNESKDGRAFGLTPQSDILGQAQFLYWPAGNWSRFGAIK